MAKNIDQPSPTSLEVRCPACGVVPKSCRYPVVEPSPDTVVKSPRSNEEMSFHEATIEYIRHYFPNLQHSTNRVPAALFYDTRGDLDLLTDEDIKSQNLEPDKDLLKGSTKKCVGELLVDRFQKDAVETIVSSLYAWGSARNEPMFILSEYKFANYCKYLNVWKSNKVTGEHDVLIFHRKIGVILIEVKSVPTSAAWRTKRKNLKGAYEQLLRNEIAFREMNSKLDYVAKLPVLHLIALPNLEDSDLTGMNVCSAHRACVINRSTLTSADGVDNVFTSFFLESFSKCDPVLSAEQFEELCARYAGLASVVHVRTLGEAVKKTSVKMGKIFLNPEQLALLARPIPRHLVLTGEYGTGKSLVLKVLAEKLVEEEKPCLVFIVSCTNTSHTRTMGRFRKSENHLVDHIKFLLRASNGNENISIWDVSDLVRYCFPEQDPFQKRLSPSLIVDIAKSLLAKHEIETIALLFDEVPFVPKWDWTPVEKLCESNSTIYLWVSIATGTYAVKEGRNPIQVVTEKVPCGFQVFHLSRCMRMTRNGLRFYKALQEYLGDMAHLYVEYGNAVDGPIPRWYELPKCSCGSTNPFTCLCVQDRMVRTIQTVWAQLVGVEPSKVTFVVRDSVRTTDQFLSSLLVKSCDLLNIRMTSHLTSSTEKDNASLPFTSKRTSSKEQFCNLVDIFSFKGCESPVVIFITPFGWPLVWEHHNGRHGWDDISPQISRALGQIILITWPKEEMDYFSLEAVKGTIESYSNLPTTTCNNDESEFIEVMKSQLKMVTETYQGQEKESFLTHLVRQNVLVKLPV
ncbi:hypothetical protein HOLleu_09637 [Holothuria leucospilota]|uniref:Uncharacterized protein n=1 Tax=Holothuria leucospilota TaxID=206669 RepID=A0A9Q1HF34_HOLLE|nr:hypothetical protein HOLleu_09637 [Holothuria leucospilota]